MGRSGWWHNYFLQPADRYQYIFQLAFIQAAAGCLVFKQHHDSRFICRLMAHQQRYVPVYRLLLDLSRKGYQTNPAGILPAAHPPRGIYHFHRDLVLFDQFAQREYKSLRHGKVGAHVQPGLYRLAHGLFIIASYLCLEYRIFYSLTIAHHIPMEAKLLAQQLG
jgi:hypothetical protein